MIKNVFICVVDSVKNEEFVFFNLFEDYLGVIVLFVGEIYWDGNEWKFLVIGDVMRDIGLGEIVNKYIK